MQYYRALLPRISMVNRPLIPVYEIGSPVKKRKSCQPNSSVTTVEVDNSFIGNGALYGQDRKCDIPGKAWQVPITLQALFGH